MRRAKIGLKLLIPNALIGLFRCQIRQELGIPIAMGDERLIDDTGGLRGGDLRFEWVREKRGMAIEMTKEDIPGVLVPSREHH